MLKPERQDVLLRALHGSEPMSVADLARIANTSAATVRRDLMELEQRAVIDRVWGGARLRTDADDPFQEALTRSSPGKRRIAEAAASMIADDAVVILDVGTTVHHLAMEISGRDVAVLTASMPAFEVLRKAGRAGLTLLGGHWSEQYQCTTGSLVADALSRQQADIAFIGCSGVTPSGRIRDTTPAQIPVKRAIRAASTQTWLLADREKFPGKGGDCAFGVGSLTGIITDAPELPPALSALCDRHHTKVVHV